MNPDIEYVKFAKLYKETDRLLLHHSWWKTSSLGNGTSFTALKENTTLIKHFGPIYIDSDEYPPYDGTISETFETNINAHVQCDLGCPCSTIKGNMLTCITEETWETMKDIILMLSW